MRIRLFFLPLCALLLGSCAYQGTIVQKDATPLPFEHSYGLDGSYAFLLRDSTGATRRQTVTAEVYNQYAVGEYFNDLQPRRANDGKTFEGKTVMTAMMSKVMPSRRDANARNKPAQKSQLAKTRTKKKAVVKLARQPRVAVQQPLTRVATVQARKALPVTQPVESAAQILRPRPVWDNEVAYVSVSRCR